MAKKHHRRKGYWRYYHLAHTLELDSPVRDVVWLVEENRPPVGVKRTRRGRNPIHSWEKPVCICTIVVVLGSTFRDVQSMVPRLHLPWDAPHPDHSTIHRAYRRMPAGYVGSTLDGTTRPCIEEAGWKAGILASDSSGVEDRYGIVRPNRKKRRLRVRRLLYLKYHIVAIPDHLIVPKARMTSYRAADSPVLRCTLKGFGQLPGSAFNADKLRFRARLPTL